MKLRGSCGLEESRRGLRRNEDRSTFDDAEEYSKVSSTHCEVGDSSYYDHDSDQLVDGFGRLEISNSEIKHNQAR